MQSKNLLNDGYNHIHFIGIGGISMSGLALIMLNKGFKVTGSDMKSSPIIEHLQEKGAKIFIGHKASNINGADLIVYTSAISNDNPEYVKAINDNIKTVNRAEFLGNLMKEYQNSIAVAGTHGKTTTTGMISTILHYSSIDPTILLGGELDVIGGNVRIGKDQLLLTEACEYKSNFLNFYPTIGIILNIEEDHLDYFKDINHIVDTFSGFSNIIPDNGHLIVNNDDENCRIIINKSKCDIVSFGIDNNSTYTAKNIIYDTNGYPTYDLVVKDNTYSITLNVVGKHNIYNSLAAISACNISGVPINDIVDFIKKFSGTDRRFQYKGCLENVKIIDDYAHHPTEIKTTLQSARRITDDKIWCVFQPHTYTRTISLLDDFSNSFDYADKVIITDIYAAREKDTGLVHSKDLVAKLKENGVEAIYIKDFNEVAEFLLQNTNNKDIIITMGAGDVFEIGHILLKK